jgi:uncharacterized protein
MEKYSPAVALFFNRMVLDRPRLIIICILLMVSFLGYRAKDFRLDASSETLVLENDKDLRYSREIDARYGISDFLVMTYAPRDDLFSKTALSNLASLRDDLKRLNGISSVVSILDIPLLESPPLPIKEMINNIRTLESPTVDLDLARKELMESPIYQNLLVSPDLGTTALQINFPVDERHKAMRIRRNQLRGKAADGLLLDKEGEEYELIVRQFQEYRDKSREIRHQDIIAIRTIMDKYRGDAQLFLGGVGMIADDLISFIRSDLKVFGVGVLVFLIITLKIIFRKKRYIFLSLCCCGFSTVSMMGLLGLFGWEVTVISSNFISLQLIITMAISIHLIVRFDELSRKYPDAGQRELTLDTVCLMLKPCLFAGLTTIAGFGSLVLCDNLPVKTFGFMMIVGIVVSLIITFMLFPAMMVLLKKTQENGAGSGRGFSLISLLARFTEKRGTFILVASGMAFVISTVGISRLVVENSFIDYFKSTTEIYQGMKVIDQNLGGTTPLDVIVELDTFAEEEAALSDVSVGEASDDEFDDFGEFEEESDNDKYWFTPEKIARIKEIHNYLDGLPETGKVLSLGTIMTVAEKLNGGEPLDGFKLALLYNEIPETYREILLSPYVSVEHDQVRFAIRVRDSEETLKRNELLNRIRYDLIHQLGISEKKVHLAGMLVLYNNMLQSLFSSQILTLGVVVVALLGMFLILFRSLKIALIAIFPNLLSIAMVLGVMGWLNIPLDMMTITIAAISVGIAVDDTIHYIHRFMHEFKKEPNYLKALYRCHGSIGYAMYYTSVTIMIGFSILVLSNFIPSIYFGLLTGLAMLIAFLAALTLLPQLLVFFKPLGSESPDEQGSTAD